MTTERLIGKIESVRVGMGGYQDAQYGVAFQLSGKPWCAGDFWGVWAHDPSSSAKWTHEDRIAEMAKVFWKLRLLMKEANVTDAIALENTPIEATFVNSRLESWRILTEVL